MKTASADFVSPLKRALVVDDREDNLYYLQALLRGNGWRVETARHGAEALVLARQTPPDLIVSDLLMPVMDGYTLLRHWRMDPLLKAIPFIVYTATYTQREDERLAMGMGADAFVLKPSEPEGFLLRVREVMERPRPAPGAASPAPANHEPDLLQLYSETLIRKLEEKTLQLEEANRELLRDMDRQRAVEERLRESEERFRATFEQAAVGIAHVAPNGGFLRVNDRFCEITGYSRAELLARSYFDLTLPVDREQAEKARKSLINGGLQTYSVSKQYQRKDGRKIWVKVVTTLLRDLGGEPKYFITVVDDITERKTLEESVLRAQRVESLGTLAGGIAHDLNNILSPILIGVELVRLENPNAESQKLLDLVALSARRGADLVKQVLSFARGVEGARVAVHLAHIVREVEAMVLTTFPSGITLQTEIPPDLWLVMGDPTRLNQVVLNLCVNARDAMIGTGGILRLAARNVEVDVQYAATNRDLREGRYVLLEVKDTGAGMPREVVDRIFEPFFTTKSVGKNSGLGLSTVLGIVRSHGGAVAVESVEGAGSTFRIHLPAQAGVEAAAPATRGPAVLPRGRGQTILVVEDETAVREITQYTLESFGYRVLPAEDGSQAIGLYALNRKDVALVITDMLMPVMDGAALAVALRRLNPALPIIAASGVSSDGDVTRATTAGIMHVLTKPYTAEVLLDKVNAVLQPSS